MESADSAEQELAEELIKTCPTTLAGVAALAEVAFQYEDKNQMSLTRDESNTEVMKTIAKALRNIGV